jgi:hypothetical protein
MGDKPMIRITAVAILLLSLGTFAHPAASQDTNLNTMTRQGQENQSRKQKEAAQKGKEICSIKEPGEREKALKDYNRTLADRGMSDIKCVTAPAIASKGVLHEGSKDKVPAEVWDRFKQLCAMNNRDAIIELLAEYNFESASCPAT